MLVTLSLHEFSHAFVATLLGDRTPEEEGRLTFDPRAHVDWLGLVMLLLVGFGWGKPVRFNPHNLRFPRWGATLVALAGPGVNILLVGVFSSVSILLLRFSSLPFENLLLQFLFLLITLNVVLALFNLIPVPPLDGSKLLIELLSSPRYHNARFFLETRGPTILLVLIFLDIILPFSLFGGLFSGVLGAVYRTIFFFV